MAWTSVAEFIDLDFIPQSLIYEFGYRNPWLDIQLILQRIIALKQFRTSNIGASFGNRCEKVKVFLWWFLKYSKFSVVFYIRYPCLIFSLHIHGIQYNAKFLPNS
jgi:hypothetical protein